MEIREDDGWMSGGHEDGRRIVECEDRGSISGRGGRVRGWVDVGWSLGEGGATSGTTA